MSEEWPRTQKALGLVALLRGLRCGTWPATPPRGISIVPSQGGGPFEPLFFDDEDNEGEPSFAKSITFPCFARPCPMTPRHGFVDSRVVRTAKEALDLLAETLRADPRGEMILMPRYTGTYSAVANNAGIVWGFGNAGVTSGGGDGGLFIPAPVAVLVWRDLTCHPNAGVKDCPYVELVEDKGRVRLVQLRDGPAQTGAHGDYIPREMVVENVIRPGEVSHDLMKWDKLVRNAPPGTVAVLPDTMTRFSHFAVHCLTSRVPIIFGELPLSGTRLIPSPDEPPARFTRGDYEHIAHVILSRLLNREPIRARGENPPEIDVDAPCVTTSIGVCHAMPGWGTEPHLLRLRGEGVAACFRYSATACVGEIRHYYRVGPGKYGSSKPPPATDMKLVLGPEGYTQFLGKDGVRIGRDTTYTAMSLLSLPVQIRLLLQARDDFQKRAWNSSFGGKSWAEAAFQTAWLGRSIIAFCNRPNSTTWRRLQFRYNATLHACHNNGKVLTKWVSMSALNGGAQAPSLCFMNSFTATTALYPPELPPFGVLQQKFEKELNHGR